MIETITVGQIATTLAFIVALIGSIVYLKRHIHEWIRKAMEDDFESINKKIDSLEKAITKTDLEKTKNFLVARLAEVERGEKLSDLERKLFTEQYDHYINDLGGNSFIVNGYEKLKKEGKI